VLRAPGEPTLYIAGDTILCDAVREAVAQHRPDVIVVNAGAARFLEGGPIVMDSDDVVALAHETGALIVAVHFETVSHSTETRADLHERLRVEGLTGRVAVPEDGSEVPLP
jgi:L-ascorbate metabolism protein UlaG (beta-lactamase superfamily)